MVIFVRFLVIVLLMMILANSVNGSEFYTKWGDYNQYTVTVFSLCIALIEKDSRGAFTLLKGYGTTQAIVHGVKISVDAVRPNGGRHSFPSAHTSSAFSGVNYLYKKKGYLYALPALMLASSVAHSRVRGGYHRFMDVFIGAAIAIGVDEAFQPVRVLPIAYQDSVGILISYDY